MKNIKISCCKDSKICPQMSQTIPQLPLWSITVAKHPQMVRLWSELQRSTTKTIASSMNPNRSKSKLTHTSSTEKSGPLILIRPRPSWTIIWMDLLPPPSTRYPTAILLRDATPQSSSVVTATMEAGRHSMEVWSPGPRSATTSIVPTKARAPDSTDPLLILVKC